MATYNDATPRQKEFLDHYSRKIGTFSVQDITDITYDGDIPVGLSYATENRNGTIDASLYVGEVITDQELAKLTSSRETNQTSAYQIGTQDSTEPSTRRTVLQTTTDDNSAGQQYTSTTTPSLARREISKLESIFTGLTGSETRAAGPTVSRFPSSAQDRRVKIWDPSGRISRLGGALSPLRRTDYKVIFPYTPEINLSHSANYMPLNPTHSNYEYLFYQNSSVSEISISGVFTARNAEDADYVVAVQHFFRSITKMFYGNDDIAGLPPVVCRLEGHGHLQFSSVPIVITGFQTSLPSDVDYISASVGVARVPTSQTLQITGKPLYSRNRLTNEFSLTKFASGNFLGNSDTGLGGGI